MAEDVTGLDCLKQFSGDGPQKNTVCGLIVNEQLNADLTRFWQIERSERQSTRFPEKRICETHFKQTYKRNKEGRFVVALPMRENQLRRLGELRELAIRRLKKLERRLGKRFQLNKEYAEFMREYLETT